MRKLSMRKKSIQRQSFAARGMTAKKTKKVEEIKEEIIPLSEENEVTKVPEKIPVQPAPSNEKLGSSEVKRPASPGKIGALDEPDKAVHQNRGAIYIFSPFCIKVLHTFFLRRKKFYSFLKMCLCENFIVNIFMAIYFKNELK